MDVTSDWFEITGYQAQERGLAGAVGAHDAGPSGRELKAHVTQNRNRIGKRK